MKVLIIPSWYKTDENPTSGSFFEEQARVLNKQKTIKVEILYPYLTENKNDKPKMINDFGIKTFYFPILYKGNQNLWAKGFWLNFNTNIFKKCIEDLKCFNFDIKEYSIIHSHSLFLGGFFANYFGSKQSTPYIITEHASFITDYKAYLSQGRINSFKLNIHNVLFNLFCKKKIENIYLNASKVIFVSSFQKEKILKYFKLSTLKCVVIPNLVNNYFFDKIKSIDTELNTTFNLLAIGMFTPNKRFNLLIRSFHKAYLIDDTLRLNIVGDGELLPVLKKQCEILNINKKVNFLGRLDREEIVEIIKDANILLSTSEFETFGLTVAESLSMGIPVIVTDSGGVRDIVAEEDGLIVEGNSDSISNSILKMKEEYYKYVPKNIKDKALRLFSEETISAKINKLYSEFIN